MPVSPASVSISTIRALRAALKLAALMLGLAARNDSWVVRISVIFMAGPLAGVPEGRPRAYRHLTPRAGWGQAARTSRITAANARADVAGRPRTAGDDLPPDNRRHTVLLRHKRSPSPTMSTI